MWTSSCIRGECQIFQRHYEREGCYGSFPSRQSSPIVVRNTQAGKFEILQIQCKIFELNAGESLRLVQKINRRELRALD